MRNVCVGNALARRGATEAHFHVSALLFTSNPDQGPQSDSGSLLNLGSSDRTQVLMISLLSTNSIFAKTSMLGGQNTVRTSLREFDSFK